MILFRPTATKVVSLHFIKVSEQDAELRLMPTGDQSAQYRYGRRLHRLSSIVCQ